MKNSKITRRTFIGAVGATSVLAKSSFGQNSKKTSKIDRFALVTRHNPVLRKIEPLAPLSVGNGEFAFTCDVTGLQTFDGEYKDAMPLCTMSNWGWHTKPLPESLKGKTYQLTEYDTYGRKVAYQTGRAGQQEMYDYLRENPHRLHLGKIGLRLLKADGSEAKAADITDIEQKLDLWTGIIESRFKFEGKSVLVKTAVHPTLDTLAVSIESSLIAERKLAVRLAFPYGSQTMQAADWNAPEKHESKIVNEVISNGINGKATIERRLDNDNYTVAVLWSGASERIKTEKPHHFLLTPTEPNFSCVIGFAPENPEIKEFSAANVFWSGSQYWQKFWTSGAAVELAGTNDKRAEELERRIILSQYLTAINCSGSLPPQETGLTVNSWYGKFHLEMHWWHAAQFALWNRLPMLEKSLDWYAKVLPSARARAKQQGYAGARWAKMTDATGRDSPSGIGALLIWQQPHPIAYAELCYINKPTRRTLLKFKQIVEETAEFMASFAHFDAKTNRYVLGPPVIPAQENHPAMETWNPTFELEYWRFGLKKANEWRERLGLKREPKWDDVVNKLSPLPAVGGIYMAHENCPQTFTERNIDHPSMLGALGILTGEMVDRETMRRTLDKVMKEWKWDDTWGWDYPMTAMTAARLGETATAIDALLLDTPKNHYAANGHNYQRPNLPLYLPGNGGLLYAIALMANGWKGAPKTNAPGFPKDWKIKTEGFNPLIFQKI
ncbi:MAG TPA: hypothetical protein VNB22_02170 [Pyrinomonadaceae bacterium]|nr:hypothetical protein [Pyrinomonadaceae bacterium]